MEKTELVLGILLGAILMYLLLHFLWRIGYYALYTAIAFIRRSDSPSGRPRALSDMEPMVLPRIQHDFPDFDIQHAKQQVKDHLTAQYGDRKDFCIHGVVLNDYRMGNGTKAVVFQAALRWQEKKPAEKRMDVVLSPEALPASPVCKNCGAPLSGAFCSSCGAPAPKAPAHRWQVVKLRET